MTTTTIPSHATLHPALDKLVSALRAQRPTPEATFAQRRFAMEAMQTALKMPEGVELAKVSVGNVPGVWISAADTHDDAPVILYLHGGGYALGSVVTHRELMARIALSSTARVLGIDYRLAPENPFPAGLEDVLQAYRWLLAQGVSPNRLFIVGDSAGGGLAVAALLRLRGCCDPLPAGAILMSPWADLTSSSDTVISRAEHDPMVGPDGLRLMANAYASGRLDEAEVSPALADLGGLPPLLIQVGDAEVLLGDAMTLAKNAETAGVPVDLEVWDRMIHVFQAFPQLPEAKQALDRMAEWMSARLA